MAEREYAVIGLGRFGTSIARRLHEADHEVLGIDLSKERLEEAEMFLTHAAQANSTDEQVLIELGIGNFDCVIVAIGEDMQSSILTVMILKELGAPKVIAKALDEQHGRILNKIGANWVIYPERDMGERVANQLLSPNILAYIELSKEENIEKIVTPITIAGKSMQELNLHAKYNVSIVAIVRNGKTIVSPSPDQLIQKEDILVTIGNRNDLAKFSSTEL